MNENIKLWESVLCILQTENNGVMGLVPKAMFV